MIKGNKKDWLDFERLIEKIYKSISPQCDVRHNDFIEGKDSGIKRQIDVSIRLHHAGCDLLIIVQGKNYKRPANINHIGEFASVIRDVRASKGVFICNSGYSDAAKKLAANLGIDLCSAHDISRKEWRTTITIPVVWERLTPHVHFGIKVFFKAGDSISKRPDEWVISENQGKTRLDLIGTFTNRWNSKEIPNDLGLHSLIPSNKNLEILVEGNEWRPILALACNYVVTRDLFRKDVDTSEFTGLKNILSGNLEILELGLQIPLPDPQNGWIKIDESFEDLVNRKEIFITLNSPTIVKPNEHEIGNFHIEFLGK